MWPRLQGKQAVSRPVMSPVETSRKNGDGFEQAAAILDRLDKTEVMLGVRKVTTTGRNDSTTSRGNVMERLTSLEARLTKLEQAVGVTETKVENKKVEQQKKPPSSQPKKPPSSQPAKPPKSSSNRSSKPVDENSLVHVGNDQGLLYRCGCRQASITHDQLKQYCRKEIFKCMKFLSPNQQELHSVEPGTVGSLIVKEFKVQEKHAKSWWILHSQIVVKNIANARNHVSTEIKRVVRNLLMENYEIGSKGCKVPSLERILQLRQDEEAFEFLVQHVFGCLVGQRAWNVLKTSREASKELSISDEAFALVVLENNWNVLTERDPAKAKLKYTTTNDGWSRAGVARFNRLYEVVMADREKNSNVDRKVKERLYLAQEAGGNGGGVKRTSPDEADPMSDLTSLVHNQGQHKRQAF